MPFRPSLRLEQEEFARAIGKATGYESLLERQGYDVVGIASDTGVIRWISPSIHEFLGWQPRELIGLNTMELLHHDDVLAVTAARENVKTGAFEQRELRIRAKDGNYRWFRTSAMPLFGPDGAVTGTIGGWRCIDDEVAAREERAREALRLQHLLNSMSEPYAALEAVFDAAGNVTDFNIWKSNVAADRFISQATTPLTGSKATEVTGATQLNWFVPHATEVLKNQTPLTFRAIRGEDVGEEPGRFFDLTIDPIDATSVSVRWSDTTEFVERERSAARRELDQALELERDRIAADLHDGVIQQVLYTGMALTALVPDVPSNLRLGVERIIDTQTDIARQLRASIFALARPDLSKASPIALLERSAREATMHLGLKVTNIINGPLDDINDQHLLQHMLFAVREMILNVVRHANATSITVDVTTTTDSLTVCVSDDGNGITNDGGASDIGHGLTNLGKRAQQLGGGFRLSPGSANGTVAEWTVPLNQRSAAAPPSA